MRRGRGGRPLLLCPPCPPIGRSGGTGAEPGTGEETSSLGAEPGSPSGGKAARARRGRCVGQQASSSSSCQPRARRCHGRPAPALRALSGTEELCHRSARSARSQDRCREAVSGRGSRHSAKLVPSVRLRGISTVQPDRICIPRICFSQSHREPKQRRRYRVAHLLGGVRGVRADGVFQRPTPVLVPFLLRGQVRLPVVLHDAGALERGSSPLSSRGASSVPKTPRGRGQRREPTQRPSPGRGRRNSQGRASGPGPRPGARHPSAGSGASGGPGSPPQGKPEPAAEGQVKPPSSSGTDQSSRKGRTPGTQLPTPGTQLPTPGTQHPTSGTYHSTAGTHHPTEPSTDSQAEPRAGHSSPIRPTGSPLSAASTESHSLTNPSSMSQGQAVSGSTSGSQVARKTQIQPQPRTGFSNSAPVPSPQAPGSSGTGRGPSTTSNQDPSRGQSPSTTTTPSQPPSKLPSGPRDTASKGSFRQQKEAATSTSGPRSPVPSHSESSLECSSESTTEITYSWPHCRHQLPCRRPCWLLKHLAY
ncbi:receptor expression-enhancing protein 6 isoform X2 [Marmota marmota marmota]|uniref:receptor expression-enhancing protein 6 isoform X2 n=1 Tax=Marmota marmota marmota TaxID=9994 RepID=UPI0020926A7C|nr:receptor expression-enhancing protein 6 isoform X2 [Marmota marmota marmota]